MKSEIQNHADFSQVRYANCWEDADILLAAIQPSGRRCLSIGSAGDNSFSLLAEGAEQVCIAEMNPAQVACIKLRIAAYRCLDHENFLTLLGERGSEPNLRSDLYQRCRPELGEETQRYWDHFSGHIQHGFGRIGKFENYFQKFRTRILPLVHNQKKIDALLQEKPETEREQFYQNFWNTWRWRLLFRLFFSRFVMGRLGRDPAFFKYVEGSVADRILERTRHALTKLDTSQNPYLRWILTGRYGDCLPHALRGENFDVIRSRLDRLNIHQAPIESVIESGKEKFSAYNLSDIFEYMSEENTAALLEKIHTVSAPSARIAYWNMLAPRSRPDNLAHAIRPLTALSSELFQADKAFFYSAFVVEETI